MSSGWWVGKWDHKDWRGSMEKLGVQIFGGPIHPLLTDGDLLLVGNCSAAKGKAGIPKEYYTGSGPQKLISFAEKNGYHYGILSDHYGLCYQDDVLEPYDVAPDQVKDPEGVGKKITKRLKKLGYTGVVYYCTSPLRARPYLRFLYHGGVKVIYTTKLVGRNGPKGLGLC